MPAIKGHRHAQKLDPDTARAQGRICHLLANAETIRQSIRALEESLREPLVPTENKRHNATLIGQLRNLLEIRR